MHTEDGMDLTALRNEIDRIDEQIVDLLCQRGELALEIGRRKGETGLAIADKTRERDVLGKVCRNNNGPLSDQDMALIFSAIIKACRELQFDV